MSDLLKELAQLPILQYAFFNTDELTFSQKVRYICKSECPMYNKTYSCPEAVGSVEECKIKCTSYKKAFFFSTIAQNVDCMDMSSMLSTRRQHADITRKIKDIFQKQYNHCLAFASEACSICEKCAYPENKCRHPDKMLACIESQGILVTDIVEKKGFEYYNIAGSVTWFGLILYNE